MKVKITLEYEKEVDLLENELCAVYERAKYIAKIIEQLERLNETDVYVNVARLVEPFSDEWIEKMKKTWRNNDRTKNN